jgi:hypothetical protein
MRRRTWPEVISRKSAALARNRKTVGDLAVESGIRFEDRGTHRLKGVPDEWRLYRVLKDCIVVVEDKTSASIPNLRTA